MPFNICSLSYSLGWQEMGQVCRIHNFSINNEGVDLREKTACSFFGF